MIEKFGSGGKFGAGVRRGAGVGDLVAVKGLWRLRHFKPANDSELRRAIERNETVKAAGQAVGRLRMELEAMARRIAPARMELAHSEEFENLVVDAGLNYLLDAGLSGGSAITTWYVGLKDTGSPVAGDTLSSHTSWATLGTGIYSNATDPQWQDGGVSGKSVDNSSTPASFSVTGTDDIYGAFLKSTNTKSGTGPGTLYAAGDFAAFRSVSNGDTLEVTATFTAS